MPKFDADLLTLAEVRRLADACSRRAPTGIRNRALILTLASAGLRISEGLSLHPKDYDAAEGILRVQRGKGGRFRVVPLALPEAADAADRWMDRRLGLGIDRRRPIFCTLQGRPLLPSYVRAALPRLAARAGIDKRVHPHGLRHFFACSLAMAHAPLPAIQAMLGHSNIATTSTYLQRLAPMEAIDAARAAFRRVLEATV